MQGRGSGGEGLKGDAFWEGREGEYGGEQCKSLPDGVLEEYRPDKLLQVG